MIRHKNLEHRFVEHIPEDLQPGLLYISVEYGSVAHSCCCGCGEEIVTPLTPTDWRITYDGETISLSPSVGNWKLRCRSHYVIRNGKVIEAAPWTDEQVESEQRRDRRAKARYYGKHAEQPTPVPPQLPTAPVEPSVSGGALQWLRSWFGG